MPERVKQVSKKSKVSIMDLGCMDAAAMTGISPFSTQEESIGESSGGLIPKLVAAGIKDNVQIFAFTGPPDRGAVARTFEIEYGVGNLFEEYPYFAPKDGLDIVFSRYTLYQSSFDLSAFEIAFQSLKKPSHNRQGGILFARRALNSEKTLRASTIFTPDGKKITIASFLNLLKKILKWDIEFENNEEYIHIAMQRQEANNKLPIQLKEIVYDSMGGLFTSIIRPIYILDERVYELARQQKFGFEMDTTTPKPLCQIPIYPSPDKLQL